MHARNLAPAQTLHWRSWYNLQRWRTRARHQLQVEPLCAACFKAGHVTPATIADHVEHHDADWNGGDLRVRHLRRRVAKTDELQNAWRAIDRVPTIDDQNEQVRWE